METNFKTPIEVFFQNGMKKKKPLLDFSQVPPVGII
jgi:hypothetical protein